MTALVILLALIASAIYSSSTGTTYVAFGATVYVLIYVTGLATASLGAAISGNRRCILGALVLIANFGVAHLAWASSDPTLYGSLNDLLTTSYFILLGQTRWELTIGGLLLASFGLGAATWLGWLPDATDRPSGFIALSYPDLSSIAGNAASIVLGLGAGDWGSKVRTLFRIRPRFAEARGGLIPLPLIAAAGDWHGQSLGRPSS